MVMLETKQPGGQFANRSRADVGVHITSIHHDSCLSNGFSQMVCLDGMVTLPLSGRFSRRTPDLVSLRTSIPAP